MYLSPGGPQFASGVGSTQPDPTARGCGLTSGSDPDPCVRHEIDNGTTIVLVYVLVSMGVIIASLLAALATG